MQMIHRRRITKLSTKINLLTVLSSVGAILLLGVTLILMFTLFFSQQTMEDIEYYLENTNEQFAAKVQFIQDSAISIRHNTIMEEFFNKNHYDADEVETQLAYCIDLFSDRNMMEQNSPFAVSVYLFNNKDSFVRKHYYPITLSAMEQADMSYQVLQQQFSSCAEQFQCYQDEDRMNLCFRLYNDEMRETGICIVAIQLDGLTSIFQNTKKYDNYVWAVTKGKQIISGNGTQTELTAIMLAPQNYTGEYRLDNRSTVCSTKTGGFGLQAAICVDKSNIYTVLRPTISLFVLVLIFVLALVATVMVGISTRSMRPLNEMADQISAFGKGSLEVRMQDSSVQEFHDMSLVFNEMADRIDHLITEVYEKELLATRAQVKYLQAQINPHFQFNILAMLSIKAKLAGNEELYQSLQAFSKLIQGKIFREKEIKIPLSSEMELVSFYLFLQKGRYGDKLSYEIHYGSEDIHDCLIPRLLIEPLVENAVSHGLEPKGEAGRIDIHLFVQDMRLHILVEDDGVGFDQQKLQTEHEAEGHTNTGLANTKRLLHILYHDDFEMTIIGKKGQGTQVSVILPVEKEDAYAESDGSG